MTHDINQSFWNLGRPRNNRFSRLTDFRSIPTEIRRFFLIEAYK